MRRTIPIGLVVALAAPSARAETLEVRADRPTLRVEVFRLSKPAVWHGGCSTSAPCRFDLPPGRYRLHVLGDLHTPEATRELLLRRPTVASVESGSSALRDIGTFTWIAGLVGVGAGLTLMTMSGTSMRVDRNLPGVVLGVGVGLTIGGFVMVGQGATSISAQPAR
jgi:hypothetical protein